MNSGYVVGVAAGDRDAEAAPGAPANAKELFRRTHASELFTPIDMVTVQATDEINVAFKKLVDNGILSVPVYSKKERHYMAWIDVTDFVVTLTSYFESSIRQYSDLGSFLSAKELFKDRKVADVAGLSERNPWHPVDEDTPVHLVVDILCRHKIHRVPVIDGEGSLVALLTQTDIVKFIARHMESHLAAFGARSIKEAGIGFWGKVHAVKETQPVLEAFQLIREVNVTGVAVVDGSGKLVDTISASDLRVIGKDGADLTVLYQGCKEFQGRKKSLSHVKALVVVEENASVKDVVDALTKQRVHRVFVVHEGAPIAVVSQIDIIKGLKKFLSE